MAIRIVRLGSPRMEGENLRIGTVRRLPRGVPKSEFASRDFFDVWLPALSPSAELMKAGKEATAESAWQTFTKRFRTEMNQPDPSRLLDLLAALSHQTDFSLGCYCADETRCHRSVLRELLVQRGATLA